MNNRFLSVFLRVAVALAILLPITLGCSGAVKVESTRVGPREIEEKVMVAGDLAASNPCQVIPKVYGTVAEVLVQEGSEVTAGQPLVKLDTSDLEQALLSAKASLESIRSLASMMNSIASIPQGIGESFNSIMTSVDAAVAGMYNFQKSLVPMLPEEYRMGALQAVENSYQSYIQARSSNHPSLSVGGGGVSTGAQEAAARKAIENAMKDLEAATITAPVSGTVVSQAGGGLSLESMLATMMSSLSSIMPAGINLSSLSSMTSSLGGFGMPTSGPLVPGAFVMPGSPIYSIVDLHNMSMVAKVDETDIAKFQENQTATVTLEAYPGKVFKGRVVKISNTATTNEAGATAFEVTIQLDLSNIPLKIGMTGTADVTVAKKKGALVVPIDALIEKKGKKYVFKVVNGKAKLQEVETGLTTETDAEITSGLRRGERVITKDVNKLKDGQEVKI